MNHKSITILLTGLLLISCNSILGGEKGEGLRSNQATWINKDIGNYSFEFIKLCYCYGLFNPATIVVRADTIHAVLDPETGNPLRDPETQELILSKYPESFLTVNELFEIVENARDDAHKLNVEYHKEMGYPVLIDIDYIKNAVDDEIVYKVNNLQID